MLKNSLYEACFIPVKQNSPGPALHVRYRGSSLTLNRAYEKCVHLAEAVFSRFAQGDLLLIAAYLGEPDNMGLEVLAKLKDVMKW